MKTIIIYFVFLIVSMTGVTADQEKGKLLFAACTRCHGTFGEGNQTLHAPRLTGREDWYLKSQIKKFRDKQRGYSMAEDQTYQKEMIENQKMHSTPQHYSENDPYSRLMHPIIRLMEEDEINEVVSYIGKLKTDEDIDSIEGDLKHGKRLYSSCRVCHGEEAEGNQKLKAPKLTEQHGWYLLEQLKDFRMGLRGTQPSDEGGARMRSHFNKERNHLVIDLDDQSMRDIVAYIQSLHRKTKK